MKQIKNWKDCEIYEIINNETLEYSNLLKNIKTHAESNKDLKYKHECKLLMRYLKKIWQDPTIKDLKEEINRLTAESTHYESKYYNEAKKVDKAIEYINERKNLNWYADGVFVEELLNILQGKE